MTISQQAVFDEIGFWKFAMRSFNAGTREFYEPFFQFARWWVERKKARGALIKLGCYSEHIESLLAHYSLELATHVGMQTELLDEIRILHKTHEDGEEQAKTRYAAIEQKHDLLLKKMESLAGQIASIRLATSKVSVAAPRANTYGLGQKSDEFRKTYHSIIKKAVEDARRSKEDNPFATVSPPKHREKYKRKPSN